jgi:hypothetical protein
MNTLSKCTSTRTSIVKYIVNNSNRVILRLELRLKLILVLIHYSIKNNLIINTIVVNGTLVWNTITRMVLNLYPPYRCVWEVSRYYA